MENAPAELFPVTDRAPTATAPPGSVPPGPSSSSRPSTGAAGPGYRLVLREAFLDGRTLADGPPGLRVSLDRHSHRRLEGAAIDYDLEKETEGIRLDHKDAAFAAFC
jgi:hypothetical protein